MRAVTASTGQDRCSASDHERALARAGERKRTGAYYTPPDVVDRLLDLCLDPILVRRRAQGIDAVRALRVLDPACGSGNFLVAVATRIRDALVHLGVSSTEAGRSAFGECVAGIDIDATAVRLCRAELTRASGAIVSHETLRAHVIRADALAIAADDEVCGPAAAVSWRQVFEQTDCGDGFDLVVGNPPFLSQLSAETARSSSDADAVARRFGGLVSGLTDTAVLFLLLATEVAEPSAGAVCLIQPTSFLSARDASAARARVLANRRLRSLWICEDTVFDASVRVCAPVLVPGEQGETTSLYLDRTFCAVGRANAPSPRQATWSALLASAKGMPERAVASNGTVADIATATADFRDQFYGLRGCVVDRRHDDDDFPPLITSGLIDPGAVLWGERSTRFDKTSYECPRVDIVRLAPLLQRWAGEKLRPKLLLATQTKVLEAAVDDGGRFLPSVPVISMRVRDVAADLWMLGALLTSPPVTLIAARRHLGAALSSDALKLSATDVLRLPLPADRSTWTLAAEHFRRACESSDGAHRQEALARTAELMCAAYGLAQDEALLDWWKARLPRPRKR